MADFTVEAKRVKSGESLTSINNQALNAIATLKNIKTNLVALKATVNSDPDYTTEDAGVVQSVIDALLIEIDTI